MSLISNQSVSEEAVGCMLVVSPSFWFSSYIPKGYQQTARRLLPALKAAVNYNVDRTLHKVMEDLAEIAEQRAFMHRQGQIDPFNREYIDLVRKTHDAVSVAAYVLPYRFFVLQIIEIADDKCIIRVENLRARRVQDAMAEIYARADVQRVEALK